MAWIEYNPNPRRNRVGDCAIRAIAKATDQEWEMAYTGLYVKGYSMGDLDGKEDMMESMKEIMADATTEKEREIIRDAMSKLEKA